MLLSSRNPIIVEELQGLRRGLTLCEIFGSAFATANSDAAV
jgi:hypothetical protein